MWGLAEHRLVPDWSGFVAPPHKAPEAPAPGENWKNSEKEI